MCSFDLKKHINEETISSHVFIQEKNVDNVKDTENTISLMNMRTIIHKLQPEDLENLIL